MERYSELPGSQASSVASSVPSELILNMDRDFIDDICELNELYFMDQPEPNHSQLDEELVNEPQEYHDESDYSDTDNNETETVDVNLREEDISEGEKVRRFRRETCKCSKFHQQPCSTVLDFDCILEYRENCIEMSKDELDLVIKVNLFNFRKAEQFVDSKKHKKKERERPSQTFYFGSVQICRTTFCFLHAVSKNTLVTIGKSLDSDRFQPRVHGNKSKQPVHALKLSDVERIKDFIIQYANRNALPLPGRVANFNDNTTLLLPSDTTQQQIHEMYEDLAATCNLRSVSLRSFQRIWKEHCPYILPMRPATDLCNKCQNYVSHIATSGTLSEDFKIEKLLEYNDHLEFAKSERDYYRTQCEQAKAMYAEYQQGQYTQSCTYIWYTYRFYICAFIYLVNYEMLL